MSPEANDMVSDGEHGMIHDEEGCYYLRAIAQGLGIELARHPVTASQCLGLLTEIDLLYKDCEALLTGTTLSIWTSLWDRYRELAHKKAHSFNRAASISRIYNSMDEFWTDADEQAAGTSPYTFWDTYEHGRRRQLEQLLAKCYGTEAALLLNSGMSAIAVAIGMRNLVKGDVILTGSRCYFETTEYLEQHVAKSGILIERVPIDDAAMVLEKLEICKPKVVLFEVVTNTLEATIPRGFSRWLAGGCDTLFVVDNSVQSHLTRWFDFSGIDSRKLVVVESAVKYLTHDCMAGVIYGGRALIQTARNHARNTGQHLQEKAFNYICESEIERVGSKLRIHSRNVRVFCLELMQYGDYWQNLRTLDSAVGDDQDGQAIFAYGVGSLIFLTLRVPKYSKRTDLRAIHRDLLTRWKLCADTCGYGFAIRAGFGWNQTSARVYDSTRLNQPDAPSYLRISVGLEPESIVRRLAALLAACAKSIFEEESSEICYG